MGASASFSAAAAAESVPFPEFFAFSAVLVFEDVEGFSAVFGFEAGAGFSAAVLVASGLVFFDTIAALSSAVLCKVCQLLQYVPDGEGQTFFVEPGFFSGSLVSGATSPAIREDLRAPAEGGAGAAAERGLLGGMVTMSESVRLREGRSR